MSNQAQLVPNVVFDGHLAIGVLGLLALIVHQVVSKPFYLFYDFPRLWQILPEIEVVLKVYSKLEIERPKSTPQVLSQMDREAVHQKIVPFDRFAPACLFDSQTLGN